jgi:hypothetical protein
MHGDKALCISGNKMSLAAAVLTACALQAACYVLAQLTTGSRSAMSSILTFPLPLLLLLPSAAAAVAAAAAQNTEPCFLPLPSIISLASFTLAAMKLLPPGGKRGRAAEHTWTQTAVSMHI